jgi:hypothetical protein
MYNRIKERAEKGKNGEEQRLDGLDQKREQRCLMSMGLEDEASVFFSPRRR